MCPRAPWVVSLALTLWSVSDRRWHLPMRLSARYHRTVTNMYHTSCHHQWRSLPHGPPPCATRLSPSPPAGCPQRASAEMDLLAQAGLLCTVAKTGRWEKSKDQMLLHMHSQLTPWHGTSQSVGKKPLYFPLYLILSSFIQFILLRVSEFLPQRHKHTHVHRADLSILFALSHMNQT